MSRAIAAYLVGTKSNLESETCCVCGTEFAMEATLRRQRLDDHRLFHCPNGHSQSYTGQTPDQQRIKALEQERDAARREADTHRRNREWAESRAKGANIAAGKARAARLRLEQRVAHGVCPCCHRTFKQLAAHMQTKHPTYQRASK